MGVLASLAHPGSAARGSANQEGECSLLKTDRDCVRGV